MWSNMGPLKPLQVFQYYWHCRHQLADALLQARFKTRFRFEDCDQHSNPNSTQHQGIIQIDSHMFEHTSEKMIWRYGS